MKTIITEFIGLMRQAGLAVTTMEAMDCLKALEVSGLEPRYIKTVFRATLVKSLWEDEIFDTLFDLYFDLDYFIKLADLPEAAKPQLVVKAMSIDGSGRTSGGTGGDAAVFLEMIDSQPPAILEEIAKNLAASVELAASSPQEVSVKLRKIQVDLRWFEAVNKIERLYATDKMQETVFRRWQDTFQNLEKLIRRELEKKAIRQFGREVLLPMVEFANIRRQEFSTLTLAQVAAVEQEVVRLAKRLAQKPGIRLKCAAKGRVDLRRTLADVVRTGGCPLALKFRDKTKSKVNLWLLCDVSNSVEQFSRFMLQLVQAAQKRYAEVRSFVFIDEAVEVSELFRHQDVNAFLAARHLRDAFSRRVGLSRYDLVFEQIAREELSNISAGTKIIILGDARNNWRKGASDELAKIAEHAQAVYWLNPMPQNQWQEGDCLIGEYAKYCRQVFECRNLEQLTEIAGQIL